RHILKNEWFKKGYNPSSFEHEEDVSLEDVNAVFNDAADFLVTENKEKPVSINAFELISRSQGFNLDNLFEKQAGLVKRETCFTSQCPANEIMSTIEEAAKPLGFNVHKHNYKLTGEKTGRKGHLSVAIERYLVAPSLHMVELRKTKGGTLEFHKFYKSFSSGLQDIVWTSKDITEESFGFDETSHVTTHGTINYLCNTVPEKQIQAWAKLQVHFSAWSPAVIFLIVHVLGELVIVHSLVHV
ncbi:hypothetical protein MKX03_026296, partial [Papaver bracteatum]